MTSDYAMADSASSPPWWVWLLVLALVGIAYSDTFRWLAMSWSASPYYSHGFAIAPIALLLGYLRVRQARAQVSLWDTWLGALTVASSLGMHYWASRSNSLLLSAASLLPLLAGVMLILIGRRALARAWFAIVFLGFMLPLPFLERWTPTLARWIASAAGHTSQLVGIPVVVTGARLSMPQASLVVGAPCSGVSSLAALVTLAALYAYLQRGPLLARVTLVALAVPIAFAANWLRVLILVLLAHTFGVDVAMTYFHDWSGLVLFGLALGLLGLFARLMQCQLDFDTLY